MTGSCCHVSFEPVASRCHLLPLCHRVRAPVISFTAGIAWSASTASPESSNHQRNRGSRRFESWVCKLPTPPGPGHYSVWRHKVQLDGSDWAFGFADAAGNPRAYADYSFDDNTFATIVPDVVSVTERIVLLSDL